MRSTMIPDSPALPPKPKDGLGRPVSWVWVTGAPGFDYGGTWHAVDRAWIAARIREHAALTRRGYSVPVLAEHTRDGERKGDVLALAEHGGDLIAAVAWADPDATAKIARRQIVYTSPAFGALRDDTGAEYPFALKELSIVSAPHQKRGTTHVLAAETEPVMDPTENAAGGATPSMEDRLAALERGQADVTAAIAALASKIDALAKPAEVEIEAAAPEMASPDKKMSEREAALEARLKQLERENARARFDAAYPAGAQVELGEDLRDAMFALSQADRKSFDALAAKAKRPDANTSIPRRSEIQWGVALGESAGRAATAAQGADLSGASDDVLMTMAEKVGGADVAATLAEFTRLQGERARAAK